MAKKVVAIVGSYRKNGTVNELVDAVLEGAKSQGAETHKIFLIDRRIEYCNNCRACTQEPGEARGQCQIDDDVPEILDEIESADAVILASSVNFYNVTAVFRTFMERLLGYVYWPWGQPSPKPRSKELPRKAVLIASSAAPAFLLPIATGAPRALKISAKCLGARPVAKLWAGLAAQRVKPDVAEKTLEKARRIGEEL